MPVTAAMLLLVSPVTLYAADNTSVGEVPAKFNLERDSILEKPKMDGIQLTSEDIKGHWLAAEVEDFNAADLIRMGTAILRPSRMEKTTIFAFIQMDLMNQKK